MTPMFTVESADATIKQAARGEQVLRLLKTMHPDRLAQVMPEAQAKSLGAFANLGSPLEKPPVLPISNAAKLRADWQPVLTRDQTGTRWNTFLNTGYPGSTDKPHGNSADWLNQLQRGMLAHQVMKLRKSAATAPQSASDMGRSMMPGMGSGSMPMASMMNQMSTSISQNPVEAASMNPMNASGGMLSRWASQMKTPLASLLNGWKTQQQSMAGRALY